MDAPLAKSGAFISSESSSLVISGLRSAAMVPSHISARLKDAISQAMPTATPELGETSIFGKVVGSIVGSRMVLS